jgi:hypothetical protein
MPQAYAADDDPVEINSNNFPDAAFRDIVASEYDVDGDMLITQYEISQITRMDIYARGLYDITGINYFTALEWLDCSNNMLTSLDVAPLTRLTYLSCSRNQLQTLETRPLVNLTILGCSYNQLSSLELTTLSKLQTLYCGSNMLEELDFSGCTRLAFITCEYNQLKTLDVSMLKGIQAIDFSFNQILDVIGLPDSGGYVKNSLQKPVIEVVPDPQNPNHLKSVNAYAVDPAHTLDFELTDAAFYDASDGHFYITNPQIIAETQTCKTTYPNGSYFLGDIQFVLVTPVGAPGSGDFDGDGRVTMTEVITTLNVVIGRGIFTPEQKTSVDMDGDGVVTMTDVIKVLRRSIGLDSPS